ncbi:hypothetical protein Tco_0122766 [Tanacetum coccineum]
MSFSDVRCFLHFSLLPNRAGEEEEHLAPADSTVVPADEPVSPPEGTEPVIPPPSTDITVGARITVRPQASVTLPSEAEVKRLLAMILHHPSSTDILSPPSCRGGGALARDDIPRVRMREERRQGIRDVGYGIRDTWIDPAEAIPEIAHYDLGSGQKLRA